MEADEGRTMPQQRYMEHQNVKGTDMNFDGGTVPYDLYKHSPLPQLKEKV